MAAEAIVSAVVEQIAGLLLKEAKRDTGLLTGVEEKFHDLSTKLKKIQPVLADAERKKIAHEAVNEWLQELQDVCYDIDDLVDALHYMILRDEIVGRSIAKQRVRFFPALSCFRSKEVLFVRRGVTLKMKLLSQRLNSILAKRDENGLIASSSAASGLQDNSQDSSVASTSQDSGLASNSQEWKRGQSTPFIDASEIFGREKEQNTLLSHLLSENRQEEIDGTQILFMVGEGGIGKTTLVQLAYYDARVKAHFEKRVWVGVPNPFDGIRVAKAIVESLESSSQNSTDLNMLQEQIRDSTIGKRFLLVLDDLWLEHETEWEPFKNSLKYGAPGSTILLTSRSRSLAAEVGATLVIELGPLSESDRWLLFRKVARIDQIETDYVTKERIGRNLTRKCAGIPLAMKVIGNLLGSKNTKAEWEQVMNAWEQVMDANMWGIDSAEFRLFPHLHLSYTDLPSRMKHYFLYCVVFPKAETIVIDDLIRIWMAQGHLNSSGSEAEMEVKGREYFDNLAKRSFFQDFKEDVNEERLISCKMHDLVHDFAEHLTKGEYLTIKRGGEVASFESVRHLTWIGCGEVTGALPNCNMRQLRSFFVKDLKLEGVFAELLNRLELVMVLKLDGCGLKELPTEVGKLVQLRYLGLTNNYELKELSASVYDLYNLQTLNLEGCASLKELPEGIDKLTKLRYLIPSVYDMKFPVGIQELKSLRTLCNFAVRKGRNQLGYLKNLNQLRGSLCIHIQDNLDHAADAENADLKSKKQLQTLTFSGDVLEALEPPPNLQHLHVHMYRGTQLPRWLTSLQNLKHLVLMYFSRMTTLPPLEKLPYLEKLQIMSFPQLRSLGPAFLGIRESSPSPKEVAFPKLKELAFVVCKQWVEWEDIDAEIANRCLVMPRLDRLTINSCPKLKALPHRLLHEALSLQCIVLDEKEYSPSEILSKDLTQAETTGRRKSPERIASLGLQGGPKLYPEQPKKPDCRYYLKTGFCRFGACCHFYHPEDSSKAVGATRSGGEQYWESVRQPVCQYYMQTGMCKFGASCKYRHTNEGGRSANPVILSINAYPLRPGEKERSFYKKTEHLKIHVTCKFHHPQIGVHMPAATPGPSHLSAPAAVPASEIHPVASSGTQPTVEAHLVDGITQLSAPASAYDGEHLSVTSSEGPSSSSQKEHTFAEDQVEKLKMKQDGDQ